MQHFSLAGLLDAAISGASADVDQDGLSTYAEFLLNGNPFAGNDQPVRIALNGNQLSVSFDRPKGFVPETARIETSATLAAGSWAPVVNWEGSATAIDIGDYERITYTVTIDPLNDPRRFWRIVFE